MLLVIMAFVIVATVPLAGGSLGRLADIQLRGTWAILLAVAIQVAITTVARRGDHTLHAVLHLVSYVFAAWFLLANRRLSGMLLVALGTGMNVLAIAINGGEMPASAAALRISGINTSGGFDNSGAVAHAHLAFLGDVIPIPGPWPIGNVLSIGDLIIFAGAFLLLHRLCGSRLGRRRHERQRERPARPVIAPAGARSALGQPAEQLDGALEHV